jgi:hypothetical protein
VPVVGPRFLIEAGFIIAVAVIAGVERWGTGWIIAAVAGAWLIVAAVEIGVWVRQAVLPRRRAAAAPESEPVPDARRPVTPPVSDQPTRPAPPPRPEPKSEAKPEPPRIVAVAPPPPRPPPSPPPPEPVREAEPEPEPEPAQVVALTRRNDGPREWNLWELERAAREHASGDVARDEERSYLLMYLREFAGPDGVLPADFDGLVRDAFGELLHTVGT